MRLAERVKTDLIQLYDSTIDETISALKDASMENGSCTTSIKAILKTSSQALTNRWKNNKKTLRTSTVYELIPNYPTETLRTSLFMDAFINILDDLNDEPPVLGESNIIVVELLKVVSNLLGLISEEQSRLISVYLLKVLILAIQEREYLRLMRSTMEKEELQDYAYDCYRCRSADMDIFYEIPLQMMNLADVTPILETGRILRSIDILLKDVSDRTYDLRHRIESPLTVLSQRTLEMLEENVINLLSRLKADADKIQVNPEYAHRTLLKKIKQTINERTYHIS